ncbi:alpha/beta hydrolase [Chitinophaga vietnamensis]|uniref:alpha/beta hydrolase n=1 Tax=Chitinophaga vietnamensis TaxID=2593957 RepID=UPI00117835FD|nr:alpha/beta hydrolase-fold protein [Chitinophaga vietnamensis]
MKKFFLIMFLSVLLLDAYAQMTRPLVSFGQADSIYSTILKEKRPLWVYTPTVDTNYFVKVAYPVLYVLDGDGYFASLQTMIHQLSWINGNTALPRMIIVGIPNTNGNRPRDLTPSVDTMVKGSGGGEKFISFLEKELIPYIDKNYSTAPYRVFIGHSLGGLLVTNTLLHHPHIFNAYVAIDPSIFWHNSELLSEIGQLLQKDMNNKNFFLAIAHTMNASLDTVQVRKDKAMGSIHTSAILQLKDQLIAHPDNHLRWTCKYYEDDDHISVPLIAEYDALRFIFRDNRFPTYLFMDDHCPPDSLRELIVDHYKVLSKELGYAVRPDEQTFNEMGYRHLFDKHPATAKMFFQLNIDYYPESYNTYDSMGDYYNATHDTIQAVNYWKKALSVRYDPHIKEKIDKALARK